MRFLILFVVCHRSALEGAGYTVILFIFVCLFVNFAYFVYYLCDFIDIYIHTHICLFKMG
jgi:hypothetical protein